MKRIKQHKYSVSNKPKSQRSSERNKRKRHKYIYFLPSRAASARAAATLAGASSRERGGFGRRTTGRPSCCNSCRRIITGDGWIWEEDNGDWLPGMRDLASAS